MTTQAEKKYFLTAGISRQNAITKVEKICTVIEELKLRTR